MRQKRTDKPRGGTGLARCSGVGLDFEQRSPMMFLPLHIAHRCLAPMGGGVHARPV
jgi:hypothetical protein